MPELRIPAVLKLTTPQESSSSSVGYSESSSCKFTHSGLDLLPPCAVHFGYHQEILDRRNALLEKARELHPERFGGKRKIFKIDEFVCRKHRVHLQKAG